MNNLDLPDGTKLFINESLYPYRKGLKVIAKNCGTGSKYILFLTANGILKFRFEEHGPVKLVTHQLDLKDLFLCVDIDAL